jgi:hypothetical protein
MKETPIDFSGSPSGLIASGLGLPPFNRRTRTITTSTSTTSTSEHEDDCSEEPDKPRFGLTPTTRPLPTGPHQQTKPPSTMRSTPVQKEAAWLDKKIAGPTNSSTVAIRPIGVSASNCFVCQTISGRRFIGVAV